MRLCAREREKKKEKAIKAEKERERARVWQLLSKYYEFVRKNKVKILKK